MSGDRKIDNTDRSVLIILNCMLLGIIPEQQTCVHTYICTCIKTQIRLSAA